MQMKGMLPCFFKWFRNFMLIFLWESLQLFKITFGFTLKKVHRFLRFKILYNFLNNGFAHLWNFMAAHEHRLYNFFKEWISLSGVLHVHNMKRKRWGCDLQEDSSPIRTIGRWKWSAPDCRRGRGSSKSPFTSIFCIWWSNIYLANK